jgi:hypothetical protein
MRSAGFFIDLGTLLANGDGRSAVSLNGCHELDSAVTVPVVLPDEERGDPRTGLLFGCKRLAGVIKPIFDRPEQGFRVRVSFETLGLEQDLSKPSSSSRLSNVAALIALPL